MFSSKPAESLVVSQSICDSPSFLGLVDTNSPLGAPHIYFLGSYTQMAAAPLSWRKHHVHRIVIAIIFVVILQQAPRSTGTGTRRNLPDKSFILERSVRHSTRMPIELVYSVLDDLRGDMASLAACSSVSRDWYQHSHTALYASIHIHGSSRFTELFWLAHRDQHVRSGLSHTRELVIISDKPHFATSIVLLFADLLKHLNMISLRGCIQPPLPQSFSTSLRQFKMVTCLELSDFALYNLHELLRLVSAFPLLDHLTLIRGRMVNSLYSPKPDDAWLQRVATQVWFRLRELRLSDVQTSLLVSIVDLLQLLCAFQSTQLLIGDEALMTVQCGLGGKGKATSARRTDSWQVFNVHPQRSLSRNAIRQDILLEFVRTGMLLSRNRNCIGRLYRTTTGNSSDEQPVVILKRWYMLADSTEVTAALRAAVSPLRRLVR